MNAARCEKSETCELSLGLPTLISLSSLISQVANI